MLKRAGDAMNPDRNSDPFVVAGILADRA